jgi:hypothetical protein
MKARKMYWLVLILLISTLACQAVSSVAGPTATWDLNPFRTGTAQALTEQAGPQQATPKIDQAATEAFVATQVQATQNAQAAAAQASATAEAKHADSVATLQAAQTRDAAADLTATAQVAPLAGQLQKLLADGALTSIEGPYAPLDDFDESWAQINWYKWWRTPMVNRVYAVHANFHWYSASDKANWFSSGCGFIVGEQDTDNYDLIFLGLDGVVRLDRIRKNQAIELAAHSYGKLSVPEGQAEVIMVVAEQVIYFFVNGKQVLKVTDTTLKTGTLGLTLLSGTNKGFGTRCQMTNLLVWSQR